MSADKYPSILSRQLETLVFIILQMFFATRSVFTVKIGEYHSDIPTFSWGVYSHGTRLETNRAQAKLLTYCLCVLSSG